MRDKETARDPRQSTRAPQHRKICARSNVAPGHSGGTDRRPARARARGPVPRSLSCRRFSYIYIQIYSRVQAARIGAGFKGVKRRRRLFQPGGPERASSSSRMESVDDDDDDEGDADDDGGSDSQSPGVRSAPRFIRTPADNAFGQ